MDNAFSTDETTALEKLNKLFTVIGKESRNNLKLSIMAPGPITTLAIDVETVEAVSDFIILGSNITADGDRSHEIKRCLLFGRKAMTNIDSVLNSRDITLPTKVLYSQSYGFSSNHVYM